MKKFLKDVYIYVLADFFETVTKMTNYYKVLGVQNFASIEEIKTAYRKLSKKFHPDVNQGDKFFEERFKELQAAYEILNDSNKRKILDDFLRQNEEKNQYRNSKNYEKSESKGSQKNEGTKNEHKETYSNANKTKANGEFPNQKTETANQKESSINYFFLVGIGVVIVFVVYLISYSKKNDYYNPISKVGKPYVSSAQHLENYQPPSQQQYKNNTEEVFTSSNSNGSFSIGSNKKDVLNIQGNPTRTMRLEALNEEIWNYGSSSVTFRNGKVSEYSDLGNNLKVQYSSNSAYKNLERGKAYSGNFFIGSTKKEVLYIQGNPTRTMKLEALNEEIWNYGLSSVTFRNGKVSEYSDLGNNLKVQYSDISASNNKEVENTFRSYYSIGSTKKDVLSIQGNPSRTMKLEALNEEIWNYGLSSVTFRNGKVSEYSDLGKNLKVQY